MSDFTTLIVTKPKWFKLAPLKSGFGKRELYVIGFDSESYKGEPFLFQFAHPSGHVDLVRVTARTALQTFVDYLEAHCREKSHDRQVVVYGFNLRYEYTQLFRNINPEAFNDSEFQLHWHEEGECSGDDKDGWSVKLDALNDKRYSFTIEYGKGKRAVRVIDAMAYFNTSLDNAAAIVDAEAKKTRPKDLGKLPPSKALRNKTFLEYAQQDARTTQQIGQKIVNYHREYDVPLTISAPMLSAYVFRKNYLDGEIPVADLEIEDAGLKAYHGGKNGNYISSPGFYPRAWDYDVNGAYTGAMESLPDPVHSVWDDASRYESGGHALWHLRARVRSCLYRAFQEVSGKWLTYQNDGDISTWITGYELDEAIRQGEVLDIYECEGFILRGETATGALWRFCQDMAYRKRFAATQEEREMAKLILNSLYGKLIQKVPSSSSSVFPMFDLNEDENGEFHPTNANMVPGGYRAGGLYHPGLAALVTGNVRARIHAMEHKYQSLMTSTDGFLSLKEPDPSDIGPEIGKLKVKAGNLSIWRERLYYFEPDERCAAGCRKHPEGGEIHPVYALHGFRGTLSDLRKIPLAAGKYEYDGQLMVGLRDSLREHDGRRFKPGEFVQLPFTLDLTNISSRSPIDTRVVA